MSTSALHQPLEFLLPDHLQTAQPTEARGLRRDDVRLLVSKYATDEISHTTFTNLDTFLRSGDVLVINTSATIPGALDVTLPDGRPGKLHLSTRRSDLEWIVELRETNGQTTRRYRGGSAGDRLSLPGGGGAVLLEPFYDEAHTPEHLHLWHARLHLPLGPETYLTRYGRPIRYAGLERVYPLDYYQTIFAKEPGSAEMPSAGRAFTPELVTRLIVKGVQFAPVLLHTGVSSLETQEKPYAEYFRVPATTAGVVNLARRQERRIIAVGTTAVRAMESAADERAQVRPTEGWTDLYIHPGRGLRVVNGLLTGFHEPRASHLLMLSALAGPAHVELAYRTALREQYQWHEFGDLHLIF